MARKGRVPQDGFPVFQHSPWTPEGQIEQAEAFARATHGARGWRGRVRHWAIVGMAVFAGLLFVSGVLGLLFGR